MQQRQLNKIARAICEISNVSNKIIRYRTYSNQRINYSLLSNMTTLALLQYIDTPPPLTRNQAQFSHERMHNHALSDVENRPSVLSSAHCYTTLVAFSRPAEPAANQFLPRRVARDVPKPSRGWDRPFVAGSRRPGLGDRETGRYLSKRRTEERAAFVSGGPRPSVTQNTARFAINP